MRTETSALESTAGRIRAKLVQMSHDARAAHLGSALSCVEILTLVYSNFLEIDPRNPGAPDRDRFILSKGHAAAVLYATLSEFGFFPESQLADFGQPNSKLPEQMSPGCVPGVEAATGSLGHGLSLGLGMALAAKIQGRSYRVCIVVGDGECNEGAIWEAAMFAASQRLDNVTVIVDYNGWQGTGRSDAILALKPLARKWEAFGWNAVETDGHDFVCLTDALRDCSTADGRPAVVVAHTVKGHGISFMEDDNNWHYRIPNDDELQAAKDELGQV